MIDRDEMEEKVTEALLVMAEMLANPKPITPRLITAWTLVLAQAGVRPGEVEPTTARLLATEKFFPTPADFLKLVRPIEDRDAAEELAWQRALQAVRAFGRNASLTAEDLDGDGVALWALSRMRWERLCAELTDENRAIWRAEFVRTYRLGAANDARLSYLAGPQELHNDALGKDRTPILCGRPDWKELPDRTEEQPTLPAGVPALPAAAAALGDLFRPMPEVPEEVLPDNPRLRQRVLEKAR